MLRHHRLEGYFFRNGGGNHAARKNSDDYDRERGTHLSRWMIVNETRISVNDPEEERTALVRGA